MKTRILTGIILLLASNANAQPLRQLCHYELFVGADNAIHTYKHVNDSHYIELSNANNRYDDRQVEYTDGRQMINTDNAISKAFIPGNDTAERYTAIVSLLDDIITGTDSTGIRGTIDRYTPLSLRLAVDPSSGEEMEVHYRIPVGSGFDKISTMTYHRIDNALQENISFTLTEAGKRLNYIPVTYQIFLPERKP